MKKLSAPVVGMSKTFPFQVAAACWIDLLGYGAMMSEAEFNPLHPKAKGALQRLQKFHSIVAEHSSRNFPTLVMNDGAVAYRDLSFRQRSVTHDFIVRAWNLYNALKQVEQSDGFPGPRMVVAAGFRMRGRRAGINRNEGQLKSIFERLELGTLSVDQALHEATRIQPAFDIVPQLQANFAFTKAYVAESSGRQGGLPGPNFYLDLDFIKSEQATTLLLGPVIPWSNDRLSLSARFAKVEDIPKVRHPAGGPTDIRDAHEVAQCLTGNIDVLHALRTATKN